MNQTENLLRLIPKLDAFQFAGLARVLKVKLIEEINPEAENFSERYAERDFSDVLEDLLDSFESTPRARRREILQLVKAAVKKEKE